MIRPPYIGTDPGTPGVSASSRFFPGAGIDSIAVGCMISLALCLGATGCVDPGQAELAGVWDLTRGSTEAFITFTAADGGAVQDGGGGGELEPLNPDDFPPILQGLVAQWNAGLDDLNAGLDAALPDQVLVSFPAGGVMRIENAADPNAAGVGVIDANDMYLFLSDLTGDGEGSDQGGGAALSAASIEGSFDRTALTTEGRVVRRMVVALIGSSENGLTITVEVRVHYTGERVGDLPQ